MKPPRPDPVVHLALHTVYARLLRWHPERIDAITERATRLWASGVATSERGEIAVWQRKA